MKKTIVFAGGGTAGHVMPNLALIEALKSKYDCVYIGGDGIEKELCARRGIPFLRIDTVKLRRDAVLKNIAVPFKLCGCVRAARRALDGIKPDLVFSKGGYAALPVVLAAKGVPILAHESDLTPGLVTGLSRRRAQAVLCAFEPCAARFKNGVYVGTPLSEKLYAAKRSGHESLKGKKPTLLIMGGSSGAATLNAAAVEALPELTRRFDVVHITGKNKRGGPPMPGYTSMEFCDDMPALYAKTDLALTRAGANALAELIALNIPALCVPLERASRGDQIENAEYYRSLGAVDVLREGALGEGALVAALNKLYSRRADCAAAMSRIKIDGTERICGIIDGILYPSSVTM